MIFNVAMGRVLLPFKFDMEPVERFRYRCQDALRSITDVVVREARIKEIKQEILNSEKLKVIIINKAHFEDNPEDLKALRHDTAVHQARVQPQLRHVPKYLLPKGKVQVQSGESTGFVPFRMDKKRRGAKKYKKPTAASQQRKQDPLKSFQFQK
jgi:ATP-dependent RNA helicase DDX56/DBP9